MPIIHSGENLICSIDATHGKVQYEWKNLESEVVLGSDSVLHINDYFTDDGNYSVECAATLKHNDVVRWKAARTYTFTMEHAEGGVVRFILVNITISNSRATCSPS